ncbi:hypothetical protein [Amycolatopsis palatopharyngis]|uniref:hypothetical protein n=1 Tax=Amycolatopsis palatopharyngis TaxID=187982 RepID=UPI0013BE9F40|nr:hypothetical protein [Amycolatopsis palatopharyngis]
MSARLARGDCGDPAQYSAGGDDYSAPVQHRGEGLVRYAVDEVFFPKSESHHP